MSTRIAGLEKITPVILTLNEEDNLARCLASLTWAGRVVVVDSGSTDRTRAIAGAFRSVSWFDRAFDTAGNQWRFALTATDIRTGFALALDADMAIPDALVHELGEVVSQDDVAGGLMGFRYMIHGHELLASLCPPQLRLLKFGCFECRDAGHTQEFVVRGRVKALAARIIHDDRKPLERWLQSQARYAALEASRLSSPPQGRRFKAWIRRHFPATPVVVGLLAYLRAGGPLRGAAARRYALERLMFEALLRYRIEETDLVARAPSSEDGRIMDSRSV